MKSFYEIFFYFREFSIAAIVLIALCIVYNFLYRKEVSSIKKALTEADASDPERAIPLYNSEKNSIKSFFGKRILRDGSSLRKCVGCIDRDGKERLFDEKRKKIDFTTAKFYIKSEKGIAFNYKGEASLVSLIVSLLILAAAGTLFIIYFPTLYKYLAENSFNLFGIK